MNDSSAQRVRAAAVVCWWTVLIGAVWMMLGYGAYLVFMYARPAWLVCLWGGGELTWGQIQTTFLVGFALFKAVLFAWVLGAIWLSLLARNMRSIGQAG